MLALHRSIDAEVEQWYQDSRSTESPQELPPGSTDGVTLDSHTIGAQTADVTTTQPTAQFPDVRAKKEELLASVMAARTKSLREQLERREYVYNYALPFAYNQTGIYANSCD